MGSTHLSVLFIGPTGIGKSCLAQALAQKACRDGYSVLYRSAAKLFRDLAEARADGSLGRMLDSIARTDVLLVDDFAMAPLNDSERRSFMEICDDHYGRRSTLLTSQLPVAGWHAQIGDPTIADSILDRLVHNATATVTTARSEVPKFLKYTTGKTLKQMRLADVENFLAQRGETRVDAAPGHDASDQFSVLFPNHQVGPHERRMGCLCGRVDVVSRFRCRARL